MSYLNPAFAAFTTCAALLIAGCSEPVAEKTASAPEAGRRKAAPAGPPDATPTAEAKLERRLAVDAEGLRLFAGSNRSSRALPFGMPQPQLLDILEAFRGPADRGANSECGAGPLEHAVWADGLTLQFQEGRFAGWALDARAAEAHSTVSGIGPGAGRRALDAAYDVKVEQTSLGSEFSAGGLHGLFDGTGPDARITAMWAGVSCVFR